MKVRILYLRPTLERAVGTMQTVEASSGHARERKGGGRYGIVQVSDQPEWWAVTAIDAESIEKAAEIFWRGPLD